MSENELEQDRLAEAIAWHLAYNFIPPQPPELLEPCMEAVNACNAGDYGREITLTRGVTEKAWDLIENLRLEDLITGDNDPNTKRSLTYEG